MEDFDLIDILLLILFIFVGLSFLIWVYNESKISDEKTCVNFYKENNYILESCEIYKDKLEG